MRGCENDRRTNPGSLENQAVRRHFDETEENMIPVKWDPFRNLCPDFDGDILEARGNAKREPRRRTGASAYINLADALPAEIMAEVHKYVPGPTMVFIPSAKKLSDSQERQERIVAAYKIHKTINKTANALGIGRANIRRSLREAGIKLHDPKNQDEED